MSNEHRELRPAAVAVPAGPRWLAGAGALALSVLAGCSEEGPALRHSKPRQGGGGGHSSAQAGSGGTGASVGGSTGGGASNGGHGPAGSSCGTTPVAPARDEQAFIHPGGLHKRSDLERMRYQVAARQEPWLGTFDRLSKDARASATYVVRGDATWTSAQRGGAHGSEFESDATAAYLNALMWAITGDEAHARKCVEIFNTWKNLTAFVATGTPPLDAGLYAYKLIEAAEIVHSTYDGWAPADVQAFRDMLVFPGYSATRVPDSLGPNYGTFYWRIYNGDPGRHGNQDLIAWRAMLIMGVFLDNRVMFDRALRYFKSEAHRADDLPYASGPSVSGAQTADNDYFTTYQAELEGTTPDYGYNGVLEHYIWENGQLQESSRDQQHAFFGLGIAAGIAEVAWNQGDGVWNSLDGRLLKGFEFTGRYNASFLASYPDQPSAWEPTNDELLVRTDRTGRWRSKAVNPYFEGDFTTLSRGDYPGKRPVFEQALAHFRGRMGLSEQATLWTERARNVAVEKYGHEPNGFSLDHPGWGSLTYRRPPQCAGNPISGFSQGQPVFATHVVPGLILAANYDYFPVAGEGHTYHDLSPGNVGAHYRRDDVDVTCGSEGDPVLTGLQVGEWLSYTLQAPAGGTHRVDVRYRAAAPGARLALAFDGSDADPSADAGAPLPETGSAWSTTTLSPSIVVRPGVQSLRASVVTAAPGLEIHSFVVH